MPPSVLPGSSPRRAGFTIASRDRMAAAKLLARQYKRLHTEQQFFIVMADDLSPSPGGDNEEGLIPLGAVGLPGEQVFPYQHAMRALCAAVKPFCARHMLASGKADQLMYLDSDMEPFRRLDQAWDALACADLVLTPHAQRPIPDLASPCDPTILQRGLFNSGFVAMKDSAATREFLDWWCERVYTNCAEETGDGHYLDQKWLDLAPIYFERVHVLRDKAYNVAYWNLHERTLTASDDGYLINGKPIAMYHFSGFDPRFPNRLSAHQSRYALSELPVLKRLCDNYATQLEGAGGQRLEPSGQACITLGNGIPMSRLASAVVLHCVRNRIGFPAPGSDSNAFCEFLTTPNAAVFGVDVAPLVTALLDARPDVEAAFPGARHDKHDQGIKGWLDTCGAEENLVSLLQQFGRNLRSTSPLERALAIYRRREDLQAAFPDVFADEGSFACYGQWLHTYGRDEDGVDDELHSGYLAAPAGAHRVLQQIFSHPNLRNDFHALYDCQAVARLLARINDHASIDAEHLIAFGAFAEARRHDLLLAFLRYNPRTRDQIGGEPSLLNATKIESFLRENSALDALPRVITSLLEGQWITPASQLRSFLGASSHDPSGQAHTATKVAELLLPAAELAQHHVPDVDPVRWEDWAHKALQSFTSPLRAGVNLYGPLHDATGMGEWARSYARILQVSGIAHSSLPFPSRHPTPEALAPTSLPALFGVNDDALDINMIVANADSVASVRDWLPSHVLQDRCNVGCWIWETEALPRRFSECSKGLNAIISPSDYSVDAIRGSVDIPVYKVPCTLDFDFLDTASSSRAAFDLPENVLLFGFFFDSKSVIERKNPAALIAAFRAAFGTRKDVGLVLKVNSAEPGNFEYDSLRLQASQLNVFWIERTLSLKDTVHLMASLDAYASMHRSEGFGLTMAEAMALGKPVIATGYSGNLEFMGEGCAGLVDYRVFATTRAHGPYVAGSRWAEPSIEHCAHWMRTLEDPEARRRLGLAGRSHVRELLGPARIAGQMGDVLAQVRRDWCAPAND